FRREGFKHLSWIGAAEVYAATPPISGNCVWRRVVKLQFAAGKSAAAAFSELAGPAISAALAECLPEFTVKQGSPKHVHSRSQASFVEIQAAMFDEAGADKHALQQVEENLLAFVGVCRSCNKQKCGTTLFLQCKTDCGVDAALLDGDVAKPPAAASRQYCPKRPCSSSLTPSAADPSSEAGFQVARLFRSATAVVLPHRGCTMLHTLHVPHTSKAAHAVSPCNAVERRSAALSHGESASMQASDSDLAQADSDARTSLLLLPNVKAVVHDDDVPTWTSSYSPDMAFEAPHHLVTLFASTSTGAVLLHSTPDQDSHGVHVEAATPPISGNCVWRRVVKLQFAAGKSAAAAFSELAGPAISAALAECLPEFTVKQGSPKHVHSRSQASFVEIQAAMFDEAGADKHALQQVEENLLAFVRVCRSCNKQKYGTTLFLQCKTDCGVDAALLDGDVAKPPAAASRQYCPKRPCSSSLTPSATDPSSEAGFQVARLFRLLGTTWPHLAAASACVKAKAELLASGVKVQQPPAATLPAYTCTPQVMQQVRPAFFVFTGSQPWSKNRRSSGLSSDDNSSSRAECRVAGHDMAPFGCSLSFRQGQARLAARGSFLAKLAVEATSASGATYALVQCHQPAEPRVMAILGGVLQQQQQEQEQPQHVVFALGSAPFVPDPACCLRALPPRPAEISLGARLLLLPLRTSSFPLCKPAAPWQQRPLMPTSLFAGLCLLGSATRLLDSSCAQQAPCERRLRAQMSKVRVVCKIPGAHLGRPRILMWPAGLASMLVRRKHVQRTTQTTTTTTCMQDLPACWCRGAGLQDTAEGRFSATYQHRYTGAAPVRWMLPC
ncbi:unnamed protein product, partial [Polarella glacialis]